MIDRNEFWKMVDMSAGDGACWPYKGGHNKKGYGQFGKDGVVYLAHRVAWELTFGPIPEGLDILHDCDNPPCCNPTHLHPGTRKENIHDMIDRKRGLVGELNSSHKLTEGDVLNIRAKYKWRVVTEKMLAEEYHVHIGTIHNIIHRKKWKSI